MDHQGQPDTIARGKTATAAMRKWSRGYMGCANVLADQRQARAVYCVGTAVWYWHDLPQGGNQWIRAMVCGHDPLGGRIYVVCVDDQRLSFYANPQRVIRRYDGELGPGIVPSAETGRPIGRHGR